MRIIDDRRALHRIPELDRDLPETLRYLEGALAGLNCRVFAPMPGALGAWFDFGRESAIAFRADMDALPVTERTGVDFASRHPGRMHACGHDGHMAIVLELARRLSRMEDLPQNVLLVFQGAEETTGGARDLCRTGVFQRFGVRAIFGLHLWPGLAPGVIASRPGGMMARSCEVTVDVYGRSAHIAKASQGLDALAAGAEFYRRAMALEAAETEPHLLKFGKFTSGQVRNALSPHTHMEGSLRAYRDDVFDSLREGLRRTCREVAADSGCRVEATMNDGYPAVWNPEDLFAAVRRQVDFALLDQTAMTTEDFAWYQRYLPGLFFFLGVGDVPALHAADFQFDDALLVRGADFFQRLAQCRL